MLNEFLLLATAHVFAVASPGADFAVVLKNTLRAGKTAGLATAFGVGIGILIHVAYTLFGVAILLSQSETLFSIIKFGGAGYLIWLAYQSFGSRKKTAHQSSPQTHHQIETFAAIKQGFIVNVLNPKVTLFFVALFTNIVSQDTSIWIQAGYGIWLSFYTFLWFSFVAWSFSRAKVLGWYQEHGHYIDWGMGVILVLIAMRLVFVAG